MPTGNLPKSGKMLFERVYNEAKASGDDEETAAKKAWGAVKASGWKKDDSGEWHKKSDIVEFSLTIKKASYDPDTQEMRWRADTSDVDEDSFGDSMSMELFQSFIERIERKEEPPYPEYKSEFWSGGMPYLSVSHYPDLNGTAVPGPVDKVFIDGKFFRAKGRFDNTVLGKACWKSIKDDLSKKSSSSDPVRISIAFLDYKHQHKDSGFVFERNLSEIDMCPECLKSKLKGEMPRLIYLSGLLIHLAMTRVPVNKRTLMEVDKSMTTRKEDAASIVGEELANDIEEKAQLVGKSEALVIKADDEPEPVDAPELEEKSLAPASVDPENALMAVLLSLSSKMDMLVETLSTRSEAKKVEDDDEDEKDEEDEDKKKFSEEKSEVSAPSAVDIVAAFSEAMAPVTQRLDLLIAAQTPHQMKSEVPPRRSISPAAIPQVSRADNQPVDPNKPLSIRDLARKSVGL